jgi:demethylmenaquinone methyltransferase / 2-methoxy-6-polyprenyl-1,4-benzoquinol methylase
MNGDPGKWADRRLSAQDDGLVPFGFERVTAKEKAQRVRRHFESIAGRYDIMNTMASFGIHYFWKRKAVRLLDLHPGDSVIDVCGGTGDLSVLMKKRLGPSGTVILYDINRAMMDAGRGKSTNGGARREIIWAQGDAEEMAFRAESFDAAIVGFGIRNLTHFDKGFREIHRVLKPGGRFVCLEFSKPVRPWFRGLYDFYSFQCMPVLGLLLTGSQKPFTHLPESIRTFPSPGELSAVLRGLGFQDVMYQNLTNGIAVVHRCIKEKQGGMG